ncbi:SNF2 family N-terminal domain-containing protein [Hygrophoropsis aurantiaca]|uniref:SNF2 family N-terminal domain-containing protein n=1 Tax=Hygrophoropsis aurantiaca TaxID=72124 RepID=A0ACB8AB88_9AGAM|nr:SNF2 family N-terminal domain-containing protein [Hygrophoropsis aurantiaca]
MESIRRRLIQDPNMYPEYYKPTSKSSQSSESSSVISISSSTTSSAALPPANKPRARPIVISSDEEDEVRENPHAILKPGGSSRAPEPSKLPPPKAMSMPQPQPSKPAGIPIHIPSNRDIQYSKPEPPNVLWETFDAPDEKNLYDPRTSAAEAEKALRDLVEGTTAEVDTVEIDMSEAVVEGFRDGITLLPHQILGRAWMRERESGKKTGGILADDMGLGKTIQTLTRIVEGRAKKSDKAEGWAASTLVVCPVSLVSQWASEIQKMAVGIRVLEHHGPSRTNDPSKLTQAHVVVTSYSIVSSEYGVFAPEAKDESKSKSKTKKAPAKDSEEDFLDDSDDDTAFARSLSKNKASKPRGKDALFRVKWFRVVLDEAHNIKNKNTKASIACCELQGKYKWCLTGTPMQNNVDELYSLIRFLRIRPLHDWQTFNEQISKPVKSGRSVRAMKRLQVVLKSIMLRRKKDQVLNGKPILQLPARNVDIVYCEFDEDEKAFYSKLEGKMSNELDKLQSSEENMNYTHVLLMLLRLRQACNHPCLISKDYRVDSAAAESSPAKSGDADEDAAELASLFGQMGVSKQCQVCQTTLTSKNTDVDSGNHCTECAEFAAKARRKSLAVGNRDLPPDSAKVRKIVELLQDIDERSDGAEKTIIFSQFTTMLNLIEPFLNAEGVKYVRYDGSMTKDKREASLEKIRTSKSTRCILISFKAGSTGLNLTACNNVILVDLWWNPALEDQAFDRAHRFGQTRDVNIFKLTIENTVEERILKLQEEKRALIAAALSGDKLKNMKLGMDDLLALFRHGGHDDDEEE